MDSGGRGDESWIVAEGKGTMRRNGNPGGPDGAEEPAGSPDCAECLPGVIRCGGLEAAELIDMTSNLPSAGTARILHLLDPFRIPDTRVQLRGEVLAETFDSFQRHSGAAAVS